MTSKNDERGEAMRAALKEAGRPYQGKSDRALRAAHAELVQSIAEEAVAPAATQAPGGTGKGKKKNSTAAADQNAAKAAEKKAEKKGGKEKAAAEKKDGGPERSEGYEGRESAEGSGEKGGERCGQGKGKGRGEGESRGGRRNGQGKGKIARGGRQDRSAGGRPPRERQG